MKVPIVPVVNVVLSAMVIAGAWSTVSVKLWVASERNAVGGGDHECVRAESIHVRSTGEGRLAVAVVNERHAHRQCTGSLTADVGNPVVVTVKMPIVPVVNVVLSALVIAGAWSTVSVKLWVASGQHRWWR